MSTSNFSNNNASKIFAVELADEWSYDDLKENIKCELDLVEDNFIETNENRSYPSNSLGYIEKFFNGYSVRLYILIRSGYYSGANLDWELQYRSFGDYYSEYEDLVDEVKGSEFTESEKSDILTKFMVRSGKLITKAEKVFESYSTPLNCVGIFSNGEAVYERSL